MPRKKIAEYAGKKLLFSYVGQSYDGVSLTDTPKEQIKSLKSSKKYVVKVDQGIKKRAKQGLIAVNIAQKDIEKKVLRFVQKGYNKFLVEEFVPHAPSDERYLSLERTRDGIVVRYSVKGGIDIEENLNDVKTTRLSFDELLAQQIQEIAQFLSIPNNWLQKLIQFFEDYYISFLEINPFIVKNEQCIVLDLAIEVDTSGEFFVNNGWSKKDFVEGTITKKTPEEIAIEILKDNSQASFKLTLLNPNGSVWLLLSGGGASITVADELYNKGFGKEVANYGEYSGNPSQEETYMYTKQVLSLLLTSKASKKVLIIGGGVANFTDIRSTFKGVIQALQEVTQKLSQQKVKVFVRRGGPHQKEGLHAMEEFLQKHQILGGVWDEKLVLTDIVKKALQTIL